MRSAAASAAWRRPGLYVPMAISAVFMLYRARFFALWMPFSMVTSVFAASSSEMLSGSSFRRCASSEYPALCTHSSDCAIKRAMHACQIALRANSWPR